MCERTIGCLRCWGRPLCVAARRRKARSPRRHEDPSSQMASAGVTSARLSTPPIEAEQSDQPVREADVRPRPQSELLDRRADERRVLVFDGNRARRPCSRANLGQLRPAAVEHVVDPVLVHRAPRGVRHAARRLRRSSGRARTPRGRAGARSPPAPRGARRRRSRRSGTRHSRRVSIAPARPRSSARGA